MIPKFRAHAVLPSAVGAARMIGFTDRTPLRRNTVNVQTNANLLQKSSFIASSSHSILDLNN
jgi:hypothetical protein